MELTSLIPPKLWKNVELNGDTVLNVSLKPLTWFSNFFPPNYRHINDFLLLSRESPEYVEGAAGCLLTWRRLGRGHGDDCPQVSIQWCKYTSLKYDVFRFYSAKLSLDRQRFQNLFVLPMRGQLRQSRPITIKTSLYLRLCSRLLLSQIIPDIGTVAQMAVSFAQILSNWWFLVLCSSLYFYTCARYKPYSQNEDTKIGF